MTYADDGSANTESPVERFESVGVASALCEIHGVALEAREEEEEEEVAFQGINKLVVDAPDVKDTRSTDREDEQEEE